MDDFNFNIENDILYRNEITHDKDQQNKFHIEKVPVMTKEVFLMCLNEWGGAKDDAAAK